MVILLAAVLNASDAEIYGHPRMAQLYRLLNTNMHKCTCDGRQVVGRSERIEEGREGEMGTYVT